MREDIIHEISNKTCVGAIRKQIPDTVNDDTGKFKKAEFVLLSHEVFFLKNKKIKRTTNTSSCAHWSKSVLEAGAS